MGRRRGGSANFASSTYASPPVPAPPAPGPWVQIGEVVSTVDPIAGVRTGVNDTVAQDAVCIGGSTNVAGGGGSAVIGGYQNETPGSSAGILACYECSAQGTVSACLASDGATSSGLGSACVGCAGGTASGDWSACVGGTEGVAGGQNSVSIGGGNAPNPNDIAIGGASANVGFFGAACVPQQPGGGTGTAGPTYAANEQAMLQAAYTALKNLGLIA